MEAVATTGAGFLLAVLWFDLMFDTQVLEHGRGEIPERTLTSISSYYRRVTTDAAPMNLFVTLAMLVTIVAVVVEVIEGRDRGWIPWASLVVVATAVVFAQLKTVPTARRLGARSDPPAVQSDLARGICRDHFLFFALILFLIGLQLGLVL